MGLIKKAPHTVRNFPKGQQVAVDLMDIGKKKAMMFAIGEVDITDTLNRIKTIADHLKEDLSLTSYLASVYGPLVGENKFMHGHRRGLKKLILFEDVDIAAADILVSIGRGIGKPENIPLIEAFARRLGATLSCSRPVADEGWLPKSRQVGTSGKTVRPKIYIALGISGAYQHQAGMKNAQTIIAVNTDSRAPIFNVAHYGIVADIFQVIPVLEEKLN